MPNNNSIRLSAQHYPNYEVYNIISKSLSDLEIERDYFINLLGTDNLGNGTVIVSPIVQNLGAYTFSVTSIFRGIINKYKRKFDDYEHTGYSDIITD